MGDLERFLSKWPVDRSSAAVVGPMGVVAVAGDLRWRVRIASVTKLLTTMAALVAIDEGSITLDEPAGPPGSTVEHLLSHASGLLFDEHRAIVPPGRRRIYSNAGIEVLADHVASKASMPFEEYLAMAVIEPLGLERTSLDGSPAKDMWSCVADLAVFAGELLAPRLVSPDTFADAIRVHFPELRGVVPGLGSFDPCPWGLGFEVRGEKRPHWTGSRNSAETYGHFGGSGTFLWVDPAISLAAVVLTDRQFGPWALETWPAFSDAVVSEFGSVDAG